MTVATTTVFTCDNPACNGGQPLTAETAGRLPTGWIRLELRSTLGAPAGQPAPMPRALVNFHEPACATAWFENVFAVLLPTYPASKG